MMRQTTHIFFIVFAFVALLVTPAAADWNVGDPFKMTVPQLPDPNGIDINFTDNWEQPNVLADDWQCSESGPIRDIHFWISVRHDGGTPGQQIPNLQNLLGPITASIHKNVPASQTPNWQSHPGDLIWGRRFDPQNPPTNGGTVTVRPWGQGQQGWMEPPTGPYFPNDHFWIYQVNITGIQAPAVQTLGEIYWLDLSMSTITPSLQVGWKTSLNQFAPRPIPGIIQPLEDDDAVWGLRSATNPFLPIGPWESLVYPSAHPLGGQSLNMAFVITPEPGVCLMVLTTLPMLLLRRRG